MSSESSITPESPPTPATVSPHPRRGRQRLAWVCLCLSGVTAIWVFWPKFPGRELILPPQPKSRITVLCSANGITAAGDSVGHVGAWRDLDQASLPIQFPSRSAITSLCVVGSDWLVAGGLDRSVWAWNLKTERGKQLPDFPAPVTAVMADDRGLELWVGLSNGEVHRVDLVAGETSVVTSVSIPRTAIKVFAWRPGTRQFVIAAADGVLREFDAEGQHIATWTAHTNDISSIAWNATGTQLVSGSWDHSAILWDFPALKQPQQIAVCAHPEPVAQVGWCNGKIVTTSWDHELRWFEPSTGELIQATPFVSESLTFIVSGTSQTQQTESVLGLVPPAGWKRFSLP